MGFDLRISNLEVVHKLLIIKDIFYNGCRKVQH